jgi:hypothetical protein
MSVCSFISVGIVSSSIRHMRSYLAGYLIKLFGRFNVGLVNIDDSLEVII